MALTIQCRDLGADCSHVVDGNSVDTIISVMQKHAIEHHGYDEARARSPEVVESMRSAVRQSSRPSKFRTSKLDL